MVNQLCKIIEILIQGNSDIYMGEGFIFKMLRILEIFLYLFKVLIFFILEIKFRIIFKDYLYSKIIYLIFIIY